jgi:hypothetical protein
MAFVQMCLLCTCILDLGEGSCDCESISDDRQTGELEIRDRKYEWLGLLSLTRMNVSHRSEHGVLCRSSSRWILDDVGVV